MATVEIRWVLGLLVGLSPFEPFGLLLAIPAAIEKMKAFIFSIEKAVNRVLWVKRFYRVFLLTLWVCVM
jgi:hypothetical protein